MLMLGSERLNWFERERIQIFFFTYRHKLFCLKKERTEQRERKTKKSLTAETFRFRRTSSSRQQSGIFRVQIWRKYR